MILNSIHLENYRSYANARLDFAQDLTTIVGENNTGKSSIGLAIAKALGGGGYSPEDFPYGSLTRTRVSIEVALTGPDIEMLTAIMAPGQLIDDEYLGWINSLGNELSIELVQTGPSICGV
jgi:hypothetical protein